MKTVLNDTSISQVRRGGKLRSKLQLEFELFTIEEDKLNLQVLVGIDRFRRRRSNKIKQWLSDVRSVN